MKLIINCDERDMTDAVFAAKHAIKHSNFSGGYALIGFATADGGEKMWVVKKNKAGYSVRLNEK